MPLLESSRNSFCPEEIRATDTLQVERFPIGTAQPAGGQRSFFVKKSRSMPSPTEMAMGNLL
jgi:hypothetical protein